MRAREIAELEAALGYTFRRPELLEQALTHSSQAKERESGAVESGRRGDNEQMEFLGDAVLSLVTSEGLYQRFPEFHEGKLSKLRAHLVSGLHLIGAAEQLQLGHYLHLGKGEEKSGGRAKTALLVDALEAVIAAIYLDGGLEPARKMIEVIVTQPELDRMQVEGGDATVMDAKSALQERVQAMGQGQPSYVLVREHGPEHRKTFTVEVRVAGGELAGTRDFVGRAEGPTKKRAEQEAARQALEHLIAAPADGQEKPSHR